MPGLLIDLRGMETLLVEHSGVGSVLIQGYSECD